MTDTEGALIRRLDFEIERCDKAEASLRELRAAIRALRDEWLVEGAAADLMNRATTDVSTWGCIRHADAKRQCAAALARLLGDPAQEQP